MVEIPDGELNPDVLPDIFALEQDVQKYAGFENRTDSTIAMVGNDFTISTVGGYNVWIEGVGKKTITDPLSIEITEDQKDTYVYFDWHNNAVRINKSVSLWNLRSGAAIPVAIVAKDGVGYATTDERHAYNRDRIWHYWNHLNIGATWLSGLVGTFGNTTLSVTQGVLHDEDISFDSGGVKTTTTLWYRNATDGMRFVRNSSRPYSYVGDEINWDNGSGTLQNVGNNNYYCSWVYGSHDDDEPIYTVIGQGNHGTLNAAREEGKPLINKLTAEWKLLYKVIYRNTTTPTWIETLDFRAVQMGVPTTVSPPNSHSQLIHRDAEGSHPAEAISVDATGFTGNLTVTDDDVQKVADKLDALAVGVSTFSTLSDVSLASVAHGDLLVVGADLKIKNLGHGTANQLLSTMGAAMDPEWVDAPTSDGGLTWQKITEATTAEDLNGYMMAGTFTLTLPATPDVGVQVGWKVLSGLPTLGRNGQKIEGEEQDLVLNIVESGGVFVFAGGDDGWVNVTEIGAGGFLHLTSPNGTKYEVKVSDAGSLITEEI